MTHRLHPIMAKLMRFWRFFATAWGARCKNKAELKKMFKGVHFVIIDSQLTSDLDSDVNLWWRSSKPIGRQAEF